MNCIELEWLLCVSEPSVPRDAEDLAKRLRELSESERALAWLRTELLVQNVAILEMRSGDTPASELSEHSLRAIHAWRRLKTTGDTAAACGTNSAQQLLSVGLHVQKKCRQ